jgi:hypothetical protein
LLIDSLIIYSGKGLSLRVDSQKMGLSEKSLLSPRKKKPILEDSNLLSSKILIRILEKLDGAYNLKKIKLKNTCQ